MALNEHHFIIHKVLPHVIDCTRELYREGGETQSDQWLYITNEILYYALPIILTIGIIFSIINTVVTIKMACDSHECYLATFNLSCCLLLITTCVAKLPNYVRNMSGGYEALLPHLPATENWFWYSCTWLLITIVVERSAHSMFGSWHGSFGWIHGTIVSILIMMITFVSTLPQYWEYRLADTADNHGDHNCTRKLLVPRLDVLTEDAQEYIPEYRWYHWYEMIIGIALPYLLLPMLLPPLVCVKMHIYTAMPVSSGKSGSMKYNGGGSVKDQLRQEKSFNKLIVTLGILYLTLQTPRCLLKLFHNPPISIGISENDLLIDTLTVLFDLLFYLFFSILFFFYLGFCAKFRTTLYQLCCCKKSDPLDYY